MLQLGEVPPAPQLAEDRHGELLHTRGILYAPDYVVNSGGIISAESEILKAPRARAETVAQRVGDTTRQVFDRAREDLIGEVRDGAAFDLLQVLNTGHSGTSV